MATRQRPTTASQIREILGRLDRLERHHASGAMAQPYDAGGEEGEGFCRLPEVAERQFNSDVSPFRERLIRWIDKKWVNGTKLRYYFFDRTPYSGPETQKEMVRDGFEVWRDTGIGIQFEEVSEISEAEIRIGFLDGDGAWSYVGRDVIDVPGQFERTMNFGWDLTRDPRGVDTPVHEIGHTLGFPHEHQNPFAGIVWDEEAVYSRFAAPPNRWDRATTFHNVLRKLPGEDVEGSPWDPDSVMHYAFPAGLIIEPTTYRQGLIPAPGLSDQDISEALRFYPPIEDDRNQELSPFQLVRLSLGPAEQANFQIKPTSTRTFTIQTFGQADTVMVLFEDQNGELRYVKGDDDSGTSLNARLDVRLYRGRSYVLRVRNYFVYDSSEAALMMW